MKNGTMVIEAMPGDPAKCQFLRYRNDGKGEHWGEAVTINRTKFEQSSEKEPHVYETAEVFKLAANGIEVRIRPTQPKVEKVVPKAAWKDAKIAVETKEPKVKEAEAAQ